jgi:hypothetical protein
MYKHLFNPGTLLAMLLSAAACTRENEKSAELIKANRLHLEAMKISGRLEEKLESLTIQTKNSGTKAQLDSLKRLIELWEENTIEVPGFTHAHDHEHGAHQHKTSPPMTDGSMLDYQQKSLEAIRELQKEIEDLKLRD